MPATSVENPDPWRRGHAFAIPAYGESPFLPDCLASLAAQTRRGSAIVICTSTPSTYLAELAQAHNVPLLVNPSRSGIGSDWNFALNAGKAGLVTLAHQDDLYHSDYLQTMYEATSSVSDLLIAFSDYTEITRTGARPPHLNLRIKQFLCRRAFRDERVLTATRRKRKLFAWGNPVCCPSVIINRAALPDFRFSEAFHSNLDWDAWLRLTERPGSLVYARNVLVTRRIHVQSETSALIENRRRQAEDRAMFGRLWPAPIAAAITAVYRASYRGNRTL